MLARSSVASYKEGAMATIRNGKKPVFVIVDMQNGVVTSAYDKDRIIENINHVLKSARNKRVPVIWVQHSDDELKDKSKEWEIVPDFKIENEDYKIEKHFNSAFERTNLDNLLEELGATEIVLAGAATNWCIRATAYGALDRGYDLSLISDGHTTKTIEIDDGKRIEAKDIIIELNIVMSYVSYPDLKNHAKKAMEYLFEV